MKQLEFNFMKELICAPKWLVERMEALRRLPPPTLEEVRIQMKASAEFSRRLDSHLTDDYVK